MIEELNTYEAPKTKTAELTMDLQPTFKDMWRAFWQGEKPKYRISLDVTGDAGVTISNIILEKV